MPGSEAEASAERLRRPAHGQRSRWRAAGLGLPSSLALLVVLCLSLAEVGADPSSKADDQTAIALEALSRLKDLDLETHPAVKTAVLRVLDQVRGQAAFVDLVSEFHLKDQDQGLLEYALSSPRSSAGVEAVRLLLEYRDVQLLGGALKDQRAASAVETLGLTGDRRIVPLLMPLVADSARVLSLRQAAVQALAQVQDGARALLAMAKAGKLPGDLRLTAATELRGARWPAVRSEAEQLLPLPRGPRSEPLPPIAVMAQRPGEAARGAAVFRRETVGCYKCHQIKGEGTDFGPNLSEIGTKLGKEALYEAILEPSAGIAFGYDAWLLELANGDEVYGLIASETADELAVKTQGGIITRYKKRDIVKREKQRGSIMPSGLQQAMSTQDLADLVEYLSGLKKTGP